MNIIIIDYHNKKGAEMESKVKGEKTEKDEYQKEPMFISHIRFLWTDQAHQQLWSLGQSPQAPHLSQQYYGNDRYSENN